MAIKVHLFIPCYIDQLFPEVGIATVKILEQLGCRVIYPPGQTCCGQPAFNSGYWQETVALAERFLEIFTGAEYLVAPSGSCIAMVKNLYGDLPLSDDARNRWQAMRPRMFELSQFLQEVLRVERWKGRFPARVTYHDACHGLRELRISQYPRQLLQSIAELEFVEMERPDTCCGFGGTFSVKFADISTAMVENKAAWIQNSNAEIVTAIDASCLMHIGGYLRKQQIPIRTMHLAEVLWKAMEDEE